MLLILATLNGVKSKMSLKWEIGTSHLRVQGWYGILLSANFFLPAFNQNLTSILIKHVSLTFTLHIGF
jgi:hypothetical protein